MSTPSFRLRHFEGNQIHLWASSMIAASVLVATLALTWLPLSRQAPAATGAMPPPAPTGIPDTWVTERPPAVVEPAFAVFPPELNLGTAPPQENETEQAVAGPAIDEATDAPLSEPGSAQPTATPQGEPPPATAQSVAAPSQESTAVASQPEATPQEGTAPVQAATPAPAAEPAAESSAAPASSPAPDSTLSALEAAMVAAINAQREAAGLPPLVLDETLVAIGRARAQDMASLGYFGHYRPDGSLAIRDLLSAYQVQFAIAGENIARNNYPDEETVAITIRDFMASPPHRDNILSSRYQLIGVGVAIDESGMKYYAIIFLGR